MTFEEYLTEKKIDASRFQRAEKEQFEEFARLFDQMHPNSFTQQKLFLINGIRRKFLLKTEIETKKKAPQLKPKIKPQKSN